MITRLDRAGMLLLGVTATAGTAFAQFTNPNASRGTELVAVWTSETIITPMVAGTLTIDGRGTTWSATIQGQTARVRRDGDRVFVSLLSGAGQFRGRGA